MKRASVLAGLMACVLGCMPARLAAQQLSKPHVDFRTQQELDNEIARLQFERQELSLGGPIALTIGGGAGLAISAVVTIYALLYGVLCDAAGLHGDQFDAQHDCGAEPIVLGGVLGMLVGAGILVWGIVDLVSTLRARRENTRQLRELMPLRRQLGPRADVNFRVRSDGMQLSVAIRL